MDKIIEKKSELRELYKNRRKELALRDVECLDRSILANLTSLDIYRNAKTLLLYYPIKNEVGTLLIAEQAINDSKKIAFPVSNKDSFTLDFRIVESLCELVSGAYSIPEPSAKCEKYICRDNDICIVPALAFDRKGYRIGYGKGFYDRFLAGFCGVSVGIAYSEFICDSLPCENTDLPVNLIISEKEVICP